MQRMKNWKTAGCAILNTFIHKLTKTREIEKTVAATNKNKLKRYYFYLGGKILLFTNMLPKQYYEFGNL